MSEEANGLSEQPATSTEPAATSEQQAPQDAESRIAGATFEDLDAALYGDTSDAPEPVKQPAPEETPPEAAADEAPASEQQPEPEPEASPAPQPSGKTFDRLSVRALTPDQRKETADAMDLVRSGKAVDLLDALTQLRGVQPQSQQPAPSEQAPEPTPEAKPSSLSDLEQRLVDLRGKRDEADDAFERQEVRRLTVEIEDLTLQIAEARAEAKTNQRLQQQEHASYEVQVDAAFDAMEAKYPEATDENSTFFRLLNDKVAAAEARKDPALKDPNFIGVFADEIAGILKGAPKAPPPAKPQAAPKAPVGTVVAPGHTQATRFTESQALHAINNASFEDLDAALYPG